MIAKGLKVLPSVIRSRQHLESQGVQLLPASAVAPTTLPIMADGVTYTMAQEASWIDGQHFAVGRWDGSLSIFAFNDSSTAGPVISKAVNTPALEGVQMITWIAPGLFASSNDDSSLVLWSNLSGTWSDLSEFGVLRFPSALGVANSGDSVVLASSIVLAVGHANGFVSIWIGSRDGRNWKMSSTVDIRNPHPTNPWGLHNVRGISLVTNSSTDAVVVTGSEDGFITLLRLPDGKILSQTVYNPGAQRGINSVAAWGNNVLIANCAVGPDDKNLWYYSVNQGNWSVRLIDSTNLRVNPSAPQVFNFCAIWGQNQTQPCFFSSTEEGALWMGTVTDFRLNVLGYETVYGNLGSALAFNINGNLVVINYNLYEFKTDTAQIAGSDLHPERMPLARGTSAE
jgi:WD40 repeat protein